MIEKQNSHEVARIESLLPQQLRGNSQQFVHFLEEYYRFLNEPTEGPSYLISRIIEEHNIDAIVDNRFLNKLKYEIAQGAPESPYVIKAFLLKRIVDFYNVRGSFESVRYFFRIFFNQTISTFLPWNEILIPSEGDWRFETKLRVTPNGETNPLLFAGKTIVQPINGANGFVNNVIRNEYAGEVIYDLVLKRNTIRGTFFDGETIQSDSLTARIYRSLTDIGIVSAGINYQVGDVIFLAELERETFRGIVSAVGPKGEIEDIQIIEYGSGNTVNYGPNDLRLSDFNFLQGDSEVVLGRTAVQNSSVALNQRANPSDTLIGFNSDYSQNVYFAEDYEGGLFLEENRLESESTRQNIKTPRLTIQSESGTGAKLFLRFGALVRTYGQYFDEKGQTSNRSVIQDSFYYQRFSYEVDSNLSFDDWKEVFNEFMHPAGFMVFNRSSISSESSLSPNVDVNVQVDIQIPTIRANEFLPVQHDSQTFLQDYFANQPRNNPGLASPYFFEDLVALSPYPTKFSDDENVSGAESSTSEVINT